MARDEFEMLDHWMAGKRAELSDHAQHHRLGIDALKLDFALAEIGFDAVERTEKVVVPEGATEFAVGGGLQARLFLAFDDFLDLLVFHRLELIGGNFTPLALGARLLQRRGAQQAADMIGAERRSSALGHSSLLPISGSSPRKRGPSAFGLAGFPLPRE